MSSIARRSIVLITGNDQRQSVGVMRTALLEAAQVNVPIAIGS